MPWMLLVQLLAQFFGPMIWNLIGRLFDKADASLADMPSNPAADVAAEAVGGLFDLAIEQTSWWQFGRRRLLKVCKRIAKDRAEEFFMALEPWNPMPIMTAAEAHEIAAAI